ncbi:hypothetical protein GDO78_009550 [Eleutherodactylus coqui]|uniref:Inter-alpha-trypsin inhibitor heavy chain H3 n=1 Tax=Eleutherodactylus coqui TaxID=57060 RepID=A0A8J6FAE7_ELECQ|nr:hypothetical protein GDO78_009550 [Eleutherodactylus coqui]
MVHEPPEEFVVTDAQNLNLSESQGDEGGDFQVVSQEVFVDDDDDEKRLSVSEVVVRAVRLREEQTEDSEEDVVDDEVTDSTWVGKPTEDSASEGKASAEPEQVGRGSGVARARKPPAVPHSTSSRQALVLKARCSKPANDIEVYSIIINSQLTSRFAHNVITSRAVNRANVSKEAFFNVDLPKTAFITNFSMIIDGVTYPGVIKEKEVAKKQYEKAVSRGQTAGLVRASGRKTEKFTVSVNVASESKVTFELVYEEMLKRNLGKYEMFIKVQPKTLIRKYEIEVDIYEPQGISFLDAQASFITNDLLPAIQKSFSGEKGHVSFKPTIDQQRSCANCSTTILDGDFTVTYDVSRESPGNIQVVNGYFVHFFAPPKLSRVPKNVVYLIDRSGSMHGESNPAKIQENAKKAIQGRYTLYSLGFGNDVDYPFLEKLALENSGIARRIYEDSDADLQLQGFYNEIANPTLTDIKMQYPENAIADLTQNNFKHYFEGSEIVVAGRVTDNDLNSFIVDVKAEGADKSVKYTENIPLKSGDDVSDQQIYIFGDFTERLWAYLTIQQLLEKRLHADPSEKANLTAQVLELSLKFKFVTPLTSMVITKPKEKDKEEEILVADKFVEGIAVNGELIGNKKTDNVISNETYFGRIGIINREMKIRLEVTTEKITVLNHKNQKTFSWQKTGSISKEGFNLVVNKRSNVTFSFGEGATFVIILHEVWKGHPLHRSFLGFYTLDDHTFSEGVHGLLGQFFHGIDYEISNVHKTDNPDKPDATMKVKNKLLTVTR